MVIPLSRLDQYGALSGGSAMRWRRDMLALGMADADITRCENALWAFAFTTAHPFAAVVSAGRDILRSQVLHGEPLLPSDPEAWAGRLLAQFQSPKVGTYWIDLPGWVWAARRVWAAPASDLSSPDLTREDPFAGPPPTFRLHPLDMADVTVSPSEAASVEDAEPLPFVRSGPVGDDLAPTGAAGRDVDGELAPRDSRLEREIRDVLQLYADRTAD
jgi:hypothetical protein